MNLIKNFERIASSSERKDVLTIVEAGLSAIEPEKVLRGWKLPEGNYEKVFLVGFGKGAAGISKILEEKLGNKLTDGWVIDVTPTSFTKINFTLGTHPLPSETNVNFTRETLGKLNGLTKKDLVLVVVCGGGSAMLTDPLVSLEELVAENKELLKSGKSISEMNARRKELDGVKGGGLARKLAPAKVVGLIFSDVPGNDLSIIASGPTVDDLPNVENILMLSNLTALKAMKAKAEELGYGAEIVTDRISGEAREVGRRLVGEARTHGVLLAGGETTVTAKGNGKGGRNQELVLAAIEALGENTVIVSVGTDGWDNTPVAGAIGDSETIKTAKELVLDVSQFLENNDSYNFFQKEGDFIDTGRLPMNVADLMVVLRK